MKGTPHDVHRTGEAPGVYALPLPLYRSELERIVGGLFFGERGDVLFFE